MALFNEAHVIAECHVLMDYVNLYASWLTVLKRSIENQAHGAIPT